MEEQQDAMGLYCKSMPRACFVSCLHFLSMTVSSVLQGIINHVKIHLKMQKQKQNVVLIHKISWHAIHMVFHVTT